MTDNQDQKERSFKQADIRLLILQCLSRQPGYMANQQVLLFALNELGHGIGHDLLYVELAWLQQVANVLVERIVGEMHVAQLNNDGLDVAIGKRMIPGIRYPLPFELIKK
ncbi:MAG: hypothetical protein WCS28_12450 [Thiomicrospira sp.]|jgi:hypothetical protein